MLTVLNIFFLAVFSMVNEKVGGNLMPNEKQKLLKTFSNFDKFLHYDRSLAS